MPIRASKQKESAISALQYIFDLTRLSFRPCSGSDHSSGEGAVSLGGSSPVWFCQTASARSKARSGASWQRILLVKRVEHRDQQLRQADVCCQAKSDASTFRWQCGAISTVALYHEAITRDDSLADGIDSFMGYVFSQHGPTRRFYTVFGCLKEYRTTAKA